MFTEYREIEDAILGVDRLKFHRIVDEFKDSDELNFEEILVTVMDRIGNRWENGELALSQVYMSGVLCEEALNGKVAEHPEECHDCGIGLVVFEDHHTLGKKMVASYLKMNGYCFTDMGIGKSIDEILEQVERCGIRILLISTLMLPAALRIKKLREKLDPDVRIIVGGAPFRIDQELWRQVGADGFGKTASEACDAIREVLLNER
jgi:methanogenic corrinoid protein MtbC1